jgi:hypothetical protein
MGGHGHRLDLVVGDVEEASRRDRHGCASARPAGRRGAWRRANSAARPSGRSRIAHQRAADRDALHLAARQRGGLVVELVGDPQDLGHLLHLAPRPRPRACAGRASAAGRRGSRAPSCAGRASIAGTPSRRRAARASRSAPSAADRMSPASGRSSPAMRRSVVVLPAPVGPSSTTKAPSGDRQRHLRDGLRRAEGLGDAFRADLSHGAPPR